jgi:hypothetical protein
MISPHNGMNILTKLVSERLTLSSTPINTRRDDEVATMLFENMESIVNCSSYSVENEETLDLDLNMLSINDESTSHDDDYNDDDYNDDDSDDPTYDYNDDDDNNDDYNDDHENEKFLKQFSLAYMKNVVQFYDEQQRRKQKRTNSFSNLQNRFKRVKDKSYIRRFRKYIESQGTKKQKLDQIDSFVYKSFDNSRQQLLSIHDIDLKRWALRKASELGDKTFMASDYWLYTFKKRHNIVSRKISKLVTKRDVVDKDIINKSADEFTCNVQKIVMNYNRNYILNTDQSGLQLEMFSNRTLTYQGEKLTLSTVRSVNNTTHSYTVQPIITMSGHLIGPLFLCLKEQSGRLGERVKETLFKPSNIVLTCSKSGKLTGSLVEYWRDNVLKPVIGKNKCLLLSDCWGAQGDDEIYKNLSNVKRLEIPKKTTSIIQPLDVYFNRQYKVIARKLYDYIRLHNIDVNMAQRNNLIKMNSLIYNQLSSTAFSRMIQFAWYQSGYLKDDPRPFQNVKEVCFTIVNYSCDINNCDGTTFICCSWCKGSLCFAHFFFDYHFH